MNANVRTVTHLRAATLLGLALCQWGCSRSWEPPSRVLVFGVDGGSWNVLLPMIESGELPALGGVYERSIRGELMAETPMYSPVLWSTIFTSKLPEEHGVVDWRSSLAHDRRVKTVWTIAEEAGGVTRVLSVPSTWPARTIRGTTVAGMPVPRSTAINGTGSILGLAEGGFSQETDPLILENESLLRQIATDLEIDEWSPWVKLPRNQSAGGRVRLMKLDPRYAWVSPLYRYGPQQLVSDPPTFIAELESATGRPYIPEGPGFLLWREPETARYLYPHLLDLTTMHFEAASALIDTRWHLFVQVNTFVDRISHLYWPFMFPDDYEGLAPDAIASYEDRVRDAYRETDRQLAALLAAVDEETFVVILSDHGFRSAHHPANHIGIHRFEGIYMIAGPGIEASDGPPQRNVDTGATILHLLGIPPAQDMTGKVFRALVSQLGPPAEGPATYETVTQEPLEAGDPAVLNEDQRQELEQIRSLGYLGAGESATGEDPEESDPQPD